MGAWLEVWTRPGDPAYQKRIADLPFIDASANVAYSGVGKGSMRIPANYTRLDEILKTDPVTPANSNWSTIKIVDDSGVLYEWLPSPRIPTGEKADVDVEFGGEGIESIWGFARVEPWDWDGSDSFVSKFPNWIWGGRNLLTNPGFETSGESPIIDELWIDGAVSGSFFLSDGTNNTAAIAWNENNPSVIEAELEAASPNPIYDDCLVTGTGTVDDPFIIEAVDPFEGVTLAVGTGLLVGGTADIRRVQFGSLQPTGWTRSTTVSDGSPRIFGSYASFRVTASQAHTGTYSLLVDPSTVTGQGNRYAGAQQVIRVKPGGVYQASVWVRSTSATSTFRFVIRGVDGDFLASEPPALGSTTIAANTWTQFTIPDVNVGDNTQIIFRIAVTNPPTFNPGIFYVDDAVFSEGMAATTVGDMLGQLYVDATSAHVGRIVWEDESIPGSAYLGIDFDAVNDSDGAAWDRDDVAQTFRPRMTYLQVIDQIVNEGGYEWRLVADATPGYYLLQVYNPGTLGATQTASIIAGSTDSDSQRPLFRTSSDERTRSGRARDVDSSRIRRPARSVRTDRRLADRPEPDVDELDRSGCSRSARREPHRSRSAGLYPFESESASARAVPSRRHDPARRPGGRDRSAPGVADTDQPVEIPSRRVRRVPVRCDTVPQRRRAQSAAGSGRTGSD